MADKNWLQQAQTWKEAAQSYPSAQVRLDACSHAQFCLEMAERYGQVSAADFDAILAAINAIREVCRES